MKIIKEQMKGGLHEMKYKQLAMAVVGMMLILSTFSSLTLVSAQSEDMQDEPNIWGEDKYEVKIEGFMQYNDPYSRRSWKTMQQLHDEFGDGITFVWRFYPIPYNAAGDAIGGECVLNRLGEDAFFKYTDYIMNLKEGEQVGNVEAVEIAKKLFNIDISDCVYEAEFWDEVQDDRADGDKKGVTGTPTFFIGTKQINGAQPYSVFREAVQDQLGDDNGGEQASLWEGDGFALNEDETKGFLAEINLAKNDESGELSGTMYVFKDKYRVDGTWINNELNLKLYQPWENGEMIWTSSGKTTEFGDFFLLKGNLKSVENDDEIWSLTMTLKPEMIGDDSEGEEEQSDQKQDETNSGYRYATWSCYDGATETQGSETSCKSSETWGKYAAEFCEGHCYEYTRSADYPEVTKCGVNSFSVSQQCGNSFIPKESKVVFESRVDEVKTFRPEAIPTADLKNTPALTSSGKIDSQTSDTKEFTVTPKRIESQTIFGIPKFWSEEKRAVVEFNDGEKISTVTINEGEAMQVERYIIEVGEIESDGKISIAVSSAFGTQ